MAIRGYKQSAFCNAFFRLKICIYQFFFIPLQSLFHICMQQANDIFYTSRHSVRELCCDYPADEPLVEGLYAMQMHLVNRGAVLTIPVLNVMNTAHYIAACMMQTGAEGDQYEYDTLAYMRLGHDAQVAMLAIMVLTTMLKRTDGQRARQCRNVLLEDRNEDFYEGLSLYERFISSSERHFEEQDFLTDTMRQISDLQNTVQQLTLEKKELQKQLETMNQYNQYNAPVYNGCTIITNNTTNHYAAAQPQAAPAKEAATVEPEDVQPVDTSFFRTDKHTEQICEQQLREALIAAQSKADACKRIMQLDTLGYIALKALTDARKAELINPFAAPRFTFTGDDFRKARVG